MSSGFLFAISAAIAWGLVYVLSERVLKELNPLTLLFLYGVVTAVVLLPFILTGHIDLRPFVSGTRPVLTLVLASVLLTVIANFLILVSIEKLGATTAAFIEISYPLFAALFVFLFFSTLPTIGTVIGGLLILVGAAVISRFS